jgi:hypothetical protein
MLMVSPVEAGQAALNMLGRFLGQGVVDLWEVQHACSFASDCGTNDPAAWSDWLRALWTVRGIVWVDEIMRAPHTVLGADDKPPLASKIVSGVNTEYSRSETQALGNDRGAAATLTELGGFEAFTSFLDALPRSVVRVSNAVRLLEVPAGDDLWAQAFSTGLANDASRQSGL